MPGPSDSINNFGPVTVDPRQAAWNRMLGEIKSTGADRGFDLRGMGARPGESYDQWMQRLQQAADSENMWSGTPFGSQSNHRAVLDYLKANKDKYSGIFDTPESQKARADADRQQQEEAAYQQWRMKTMQRLDAFSKEMGMPVEELIKRGDLGVMNAGRTATTAAGNAAYGAGLGNTGISSMNTQRAVTDAQAKYQMGRQQLSLQATQGLLGEMGNMAHEREDTRRYEQGMNLQLQGAREQANQMRYAQNQQMLSQGLGIVGGVAGAYFGGPAGASIGYNIGSGLGGMAAGGYRPTNLSYPSGTYRPGSGGLGRYGGRNNFGGSQ